MEVEGQRTMKQYCSSFQDLHLLELRYVRSGYRYQYSSVSFHGGRVCQAQKPQPQVVVQL
jgi:hypothetical protein